jgi:hypothetical protein
MIREKLCFLDSRYLWYIQIHFGAKQCFDVDINGNDNLGQWILKYNRGGSPNSDLDFVMKW